MKRPFDKRNGARNVKPLSPGDMVWIPEREAEEILHSCQQIRVISIKSRVLV